MFMEFNESKYAVPSWRKFWPAVKIAEGALVSQYLMFATKTQFMKWCLYLKNWTLRC